MPTVADQMVETLHAAGVRRIWGIVGDSLNGFTDAIRRRPQGEMEWLHVRHEEVAAFAAAGEAETTGQLAVCAGSCGPGNLHLINGLFDAHRSRVPVVAIAAHIPSAEIGSGYFQETHPEELFRECSSYCELVSSAAQMPRALEIAIRRAVAERCVSVIVIPGDVACRKSPRSSPPIRWRCCPRAPPSPSPRSGGGAGRSAQRRHRVTLLCGGGTAGAHDEVVGWPVC
jgi:pyruvate dehydrogenase (quinone)